MAYGDDPYGAPDTGGDWFDQNGFADATSGYGHPVYDQIASYIKAATGRDPSVAEVSQWGTNVDARYMQSIRETIARTPEAVEYAKRAAAPAVDQGPSSGGGAGELGDPRTWTPERLQAYYESRGGTGQWPEIDYWMSKRQELYDRGQQIGDPGYGLMRLSKADSITPPEQRYMAGSQAPTAGPGMLDPWTEAYTPPTRTPPPAFEAPDPSKVFDDPSFKFRMDEGLKALRRSKAASGTLLTGGAMKDMNAWAQNYASQEYDKVYDRAASEDQVRYGRDLGEYGIARENAQATYGDRQSTFFANQDRPFDKLYQFSTLGVNALNAATGRDLAYTGMSNDALMGGTANSNAYSTSGANASAAGTVGGSNARAAGYGAAGSALAQSLPYWQRGSALRNPVPSYVP